MEPQWIGVGISLVSLLIVLVSRNNAGVNDSLLAGKQFKEAVADIAKGCAVNPCEGGKCGVVVTPIFEHRVREIANAICTERMSEFGAEFVRAEVHKEVTENFRMKIAELTEAVRNLDGTVKEIPSQLNEAISRLESVVTQGSRTTKRRTR